MVPAAMMTGLQLVGTIPESHVDVRLQELEAIDVKVEQPTGAQFTWLPVSVGYSLASPVRAPLYW